MDINAAISDWIVSVLQEIGNPSQLQPDAQAYQDHALLLSDMRSNLSDQLNQLNWDGTGADAYRDALKAHLEHLEQAAAVAEATSQTVTTHAQTAWVIVREIIGIVLELIEIMLVAMAISWFLGAFVDVFVAARALPLIRDVVALVQRMRALVTATGDALRAQGVAASRLAGVLEHLVLTYLPTYARAYVGFYVGLAVPNLMSGQPVDWATNAWQVGVFAGFDSALNLGWDAFELTRLGLRFKDGVEASAAVPRQAAKSIGNWLKQPARARTTEAEFAGPSTGGRAAAADGPRPLDLARDEAEPQPVELESISGSERVPDSRVEPEPVDAPTSPDELTPTRATSKSSLDAPERLAGDSPVPASRPEPDRPATTEPTTTEPPTTEPPTTEPPTTEPAITERTTTPADRPVTTTRTPESSQPALRPAAGDERLPATRPEPARATADSDVRPSSQEADDQPTTPVHQQSEPDRAAATEPAIPRSDAAITRAPTPEPSQPALRHASSAERPATTRPEPARSEHDADVQPQTHESHDRITPVRDEPPAPQSTRPAAETPDAAPPPGVPASDQPAPADPFVARTGPQATYIGLKEAVNTVIGNVALSAVTAHVTHQDIDSQAFGITAAVSLLAGPRLGLYKYSRVGERFAHDVASHQLTRVGWSVRRGPRPGSNGGKMWIAATPIQYAFYAEYFAIQQAVRNAMNGSTTNTELDPSRT